MFVVRKRGPSSRLITNKAIQANQFQLVSTYVFIRLLFYRPHLQQKGFQYTKFQLCIYLTKSINSTYPIYNFTLVK